MTHITTLSEKSECAVNRKQPRTRTKNLNNRVRRPFTRAVPRIAKSESIRNGNHLQMWQSYKGLCQETTFSTGVGELSLPDTISTEIKHFTKIEIEKNEC